MIIASTSSSPHKENLCGSCYFRSTAVVQKWRSGPIQSDPLLTLAMQPSNNESWSSIQAIDDLFKDWFEHDLKDWLKHPNIPKRVYTKEIRPVIGNQVTALDVQEVIRRIVDSNQPTIANNTLIYMKQLFRHANKLALTQMNPTAAFRVNDAGGVEESRARVLTEDEIQIVFRVLR